MTDEPKDEPPQGDTGDDSELAFRASDRVLAGVLLVGVLVLGYICLDVLTDGRLTATLTRKGSQP